ncbi:MAG: M48 family metallopeptidase [Steroidobacteraceae bacterium]
MMDFSSHQQLPLLVEQVDAAWQVRVSPRTRRLSIKIYPAGRVEVVVPPRTSASRVQQFVSKHRDWINVRVSECIAQQRALTPPAELVLPSIGHLMHIEYRYETGFPRLKTLNQSQLLLRGPITESKAWSRLLVGWLNELLHQEFQQRLQQLAVTHDFKFDRLQIRRQRTRWGSCSTSGTISLNLCAAFLQPEVLHYLMIHELCHTRHMNHSSQFWDLVEACEPDYRRLDKELNKAWKQVPAWIFISR